MNLALIEQLVELLMEAVQIGAKFGPQLIQDIEELWSIATSGTDLTPEQQALADNTYAIAKKAFEDQAAIDETEDGP